jgi:UDP-N-acetyl-alpha-D-muramoyl-L-alanyl-L-glutamate epimerase
MKARAEIFSYSGLQVSGDEVVGHYDLDGRSFREVVTFDGVGLSSSPAAIAVAQLWYLVAGLSYYKAGAAKVIDLRDTPAGPHAKALLAAALHDGLAEFSFHNELDLDDVLFVGGAESVRSAPSLDARRVLTPFGGGIDSVVTVSELRGHVEQSLFVLSPSSGRFTPLEETAKVTQLEVVRATRTLDPRMERGDETFYNGHVPVTAMVSLLAAVAAIATGRGGVAMSNEHSASSPNMRWHDRDVNHQWSKSFEAEELLARAISEVAGDDFVFASYLRDRSEIFVAAVFSQLPEYHPVFRSCNRAFSQASDQRASTWCGECDKCLFINLVLAPFLSRDALREIFSGEPLSDPARAEQLRTLVGLGTQHKPFECVGDPDESAAALQRLNASGTWDDVAEISSLAKELGPERDFHALLTNQGPSSVPAHWLR